MKKAAVIYWSGTGNTEAMANAVLDGKSALKGKRVALFGSYGWGGGEWMQNWERDCRSSGIQLACDSVICNDAPDDAALAACQALGKALVD